MKSFEKYVDRRSISEIEYDRRVAEIDAAEKAEYELFEKECAVQGILVCPHGNVPCPLYCFNKAKKAFRCRKYGDLVCPLLGGRRE
jgi:hypothetical protein